MCDLTNPAFHDEDKARKYLEAQRWPDGAVCPTCGKTETVKNLPATSMKNKKGEPQKGWYHCKGCRKKFTVRVGTLFERSHIPLQKWLFAFHLVTASKKGMSAHQVHRMLGITYKTAWFMCHRIREAMGGTESDQSGPIGGENKVVESDETYVGGKAKNVHKSKPIPKKHAVVTLVERDGEVRARHVANVTAKNIRDHLVTNADSKSHLMSDESKVYVGVGREFKGHLAVNHSKDEYVRLGGFAHVNTAESFHAIIKRSVYGTFHAVSEQHLQRYINEVAFRWNNRSALGIDDAARAANALKGIEGKRLTYRRPD